MRSLSLVLLAASAAFAAPVIKVVPALAPNGYGSPYFDIWQANAIYALGHGLSAWGEAGTPGYYEAGSEYGYTEVVVTGFPSWMGAADPGSVFGAAFAGELGNRMHFGLVIDGQGTQFSISQLTFESHSNPASDLGWTTGGYVYGPGYQGVLAGADHVLWTADDVYVTPDDPTQLVDGLVGRGSGDSFDAYCPGCTTTAQRQAQLDAAASRGGGNYSFIGAYMLNLGQESVSGSGAFDITAPEPASWLLLLPLAGLLIRRKR